MSLQTKLKTYTRMGRKNEMTKAPGLRIVSYDLKSEVRR